MSKYLQFDDSFSQPNAAADSIFKTTEVKQENRHDTRGKATAKAAGLAQQLHAISQENSSEPDWQGMMLSAETGLQKMQIKEARQAWLDEKKYAALLEQQAAMDARIQQVKTMPNRNKAFYERLQREDSRTYWSTEVQRLIKADKSAQGLYFHMKK